MSSNRYQIDGPWHYGGALLEGPYLKQHATLLDKRTGTRWAEGAWRVVDARNGRRVGPVFKGETAWSDADRLGLDLTLQHRRGES